MGLTRGCRHARWRRGCVRRKRGSGSNAHYLAGSNPCDCQKRGRNKGSEILESDARRNENNDTEPRPSQVLLELEVPVSRDEDFEPGVRGSLKQLAVLQTRPTLLLHRANLMPCELAC